MKNCITFALDELGDGTVADADNAGVQGPPGTFRFISPAMSNLIHLFILSTTNSC